VAGGAGTQAIAERLLALVALAPHSQRIVRRAARSAERLGARLDVLVVRPPGRTPSAEDREQLESLRRLTAMLGARLLVEEGEDVAAVAIEVAHRLGSTYVLMGSPSARRGLGRLREPLVMRLLDGLPGIDVRIVADPTLREEGRAEGRDTAA
jgi:two-component system sensor histidine kinase KdpD